MRALLLALMIAVWAAPAPARSCRGPHGRFVKCPPVPTPTPVPSGWVPSPSLAGLPPVPTPFDINLGLQKAWGAGAIPVSSAPDVVGAFRFIMRDAGVSNDDPLVYPCQPGKSHLHQFYGRKGWGACSTYENMRASSGQPGNDFNGAMPDNGSGYWMPAMLDANGQVVKPLLVAGYYKRRPASDPKCSLTSGDPRAEGNCITIPNGLRFIFGYDMLTGKSPTGQLWFNCDGPSAKSGHYANLTIAMANCPVGNKLGEIIEAPSCWDGKNLDSPNHRDHVAYPGYGDWGYLRCPLTHPYLIPSITLGAWFPSVLGMHLSSDAMVPGAEPGTTFHADYFEAWDPTVKAMWTDNCINKMLNCSGGDLGNGLQLRGAQ